MVFVDNVPDILKAIDVYVAPPGYGYGEIGKYIDQQDKKEDFIWIFFLFRNVYYTNYVKRHVKTESADKNLI